jgi:hypothetical protein
MQEGGTNPIMFDLLIIDMVGILDEDHTPTVLSVIRDRLRLPRVNVDLVSEEFFMRTLPGLVAPVEIERALNELEEYICEGWQGEMAPGDFLIVLVIDQHTSGPFILQVLEEMTQRTVLVPTVLPLEIRSKGRQRIVLGERRDLPLKWRCQLGDTVVLITDVWLAGECEENGDPPAFPRGTPLTIVERAVRLPQLENGDALLAVAAPEGSDTPLSIVLPWSLVAHPSEWRVGRPLPERLRAVAASQLYGWLAVRVEREA